MTRSPLFSLRSAAAKCRRASGSRKIQSSRIAPFVRRNVPARAMCPRAPRSAPDRTERDHRLLISRSAPKPLTTGNFGSDIPLGRKQSLQSHEVLDALDDYAVEFTLAVLTPVGTAISNRRTILPSRIWMISYIDQTIRLTDGALA
jgi:hypothetical protein